MADRRMTWIDSLKGVAILGVVMIHSGGAAMPSLLGRVGNIGKNGVQLFFLLSAYLSFKSYARYICKVDNTKKSNVIWVANKLIRLLPMYYLALIVYGIYFSFIGENYVSIGNIFAHVTFIFGFFPRYCNSLIGVEWYLGTLIIFYLLVPFLYKLINSLEKSLMWVILGGIICCAVNLMSDKLTNIYCNTYDYISYFGTFWIFVQLPVLLLGIMMYHLLESDILKQVKYKKYMSYVLLIFAVCMMMGMILERNKILGYSNEMLFGICFFSCAISQYLHKSFFIDNSLLRFLGKYSYPVYLFHILIIKLYKRYVPIIVDNLVVDWIILYIGTIIFTLLLSAVLTKFIDEPIVKVLQRRI